MNVTKASAWGAAGVLAAGMTGGLTYAAVATPAAASAGGPMMARPGAVGQDMGAHAGMYAGQRMHRGALLRRLEHGELTVRTRQGDRVVDVQRGTVDSVSGDAISVTSHDAFQATYTVTSDTKVRGPQGPADIGAVHQGDTVFVIGTDGKALRVFDRAAGTSTSS